MSTLYDEVPYPSHPFRQTHPTRLAVAAALYGLPHAPPRTARILEIGCGEGGNIIPMALAYPEARLVGFDLAASAIEIGRGQIEALGLGNIRLEALDILDAGPELGAFDYIIAHGVYSWVPDAVREGLMRLIGRHLAPEGVAFVSYNALPGAHLRLLIRDMLLFALDGIEGVDARLKAARAFLEAYVAVPAEDDPTTAVLQKICRGMLARDAHALFHDELGPFFNPVHLHQFAAQARACGLQHLADAEGVSWREELFPTAAGQAARHLAGDDFIALQQNVDFFRTRSFRQSILCKAEVAVDRKVDPRRLRSLFVAAPAKAVGDAVDLGSGAPVKFELGPDRSIQIDDPVLKTALARIGQSWPAAVAVAELPDHPDVDEALLQLFCVGHVDLSVEPLPFVLDPGERPRASPLARLQIANGGKSVTTLNHAVAIFEDETGRRFLSLLDGSRTREALAADMARVDGEAPVEPAQVDAHLASLAKLGVLVA